MSDEFDEFDEYFEDGNGADDVCIEYFKLNLHPRSKKIQEQFDSTRKISELTIAEKLHFEEAYSEIKFSIFFGQEPVNSQNWHDFLQNNIRTHALYALAHHGKIQIDGFDSTAAMSMLKIGVNTEVEVPTSGAFVITLKGDKGDDIDGMEVIIRLNRDSTSVEWATFCKDSVEYSKWDTIFRAAIKEYNQYKNNVFDQAGNFIDLPQVSFDDIFLDDSIRDMVQTNIIDYMDKEKVRIKKLNGIPTKRGIIFAGAPGTGKTFLSRVLANTLNVTFIVVTNLASLTELKYIFKLVTQFDRVVLLFEDIDTYIKHRSSGSELLPTMLNALDGVEVITNHLVVICTTNDVSSFDDALKDRPGRFDLILSFAAPSKSLKQTMLQELCKKKDVTQTDFEEVISKVPAEYTGAHLKELYISACVLAIEENSVNKEDMAILTTDIFERALNKIEHGSETKRIIGFGSDDNQK